MIRKTIEVLQQRGAAGNAQMAVEYAKSGRSSCRGCGALLAVGALRLGYLALTTKVQRMIPIWYHPGCFFKEISLGDVAELKGFGEISPEDQTEVRVFAQRQAKRKAEDEAEGDEKRARRRGQDSQDDGDGDADGEVAPDLRAQTEMVWSIRDTVSLVLAHLTPAARKVLLRDVLAHNGVRTDEATKEVDLLAYTADLLCFGAAQVCPECRGSRLVPSEHDYHCPCTQEWGACVYATTHPVFDPFVGPSPSCQIPFLTEFYFEPHPRLFTSRVVQRLFTGVVFSLILNSQETLTLKE